MFCQAESRLVSSPGAARGFQPPCEQEEAVFLLPWNSPDDPFGGAQVQLQKQPPYGLEPVLLFPLKFWLLLSLSVSTWG